MRQIQSVSPLAFLGLGLVMLVLHVALGLAQPPGFEPAGGKDLPIVQPLGDFASMFSDDEDEDDDEAPDQDPGGILPGFIPDEIPPGVTQFYISLQSNSIDGDHIVLDVVVTDIDEPVSGIALKLSYPTEFSTFIGCSDGELFPPGPCFFAVEPEMGEVYVARSVTSPDQVTPVVGAQVIVRLEFAVETVGEGPIVIENQNLNGGDASALLDINGDPIFVQWFAGILKGQQLQLRARVVQILKRSLPVVDPIDYAAAVATDRGRLSKPDADQGSWLSRSGSAPRIVCQLL